MNTKTSSRQLLDGILVADSTPALPQEVQRNIRSLEGKLPARTDGTAALSAGPFHFEKSVEEYEIELRAWRVSREATAQVTEELGRHLRAQTAALLLDSREHIRPARVGRELASNVRLSVWNGSNFDPNYSLHPHNDTDQLSLYDVHDGDLGEVVVETMVSIVFILSAPDSGGDLLIWKQGTLDQGQVSKKVPTGFVPDTATLPAADHTIPPRTNRLILFPSSWIHGVDAVAGTSARMVATGFAAMTKNNEYIWWT